MAMQIIVNTTIHKVEFEQLIVAGYDPRVPKEGLTVPMVGMPYSLPIALPTISARKAS